MGQKFALWQRPGLETTSGDHETRIVRIERKLSSISEQIVELGDGIRFGILNVGSFLDIETTTAGPTTYGIRLKADAVSITDPGIILESGGYTWLASSIVQIGSAIPLEVGNAITTFGVSNGAIFPREIRFQLGNTTTGAQGSKVVIYDAAGISIFEVRDDGTFHMKAGEIWNADL